MNCVCVCVRVCVWLQRGEDVRAEQGRPQARQDGHRVGAPAHLGRKTTHVTSILTSRNHSGGGEAREGAREDGSPASGSGVVPLKMLG